jgi:serine/threonine protein kinase
MHDFADASSAESSMEGRQVGQYILETKLGQGGMAEVWKARHKVLNKHVAIKFLVPGFAGVPDIERRFLSEGQRLAQLSHHNIVSAYDFIYENQRSYLVMRFIEGESLDDHLYRLQGPMAMPEVLTISGDVLRALGYAHAQHIIHRDVKPSNILLENTGQAFVMDFGIALVLGERRQTRVGTVIGTPHYMSPEQIIGGDKIDQRSDIYSYGVVLYSMLTGKLPFDVDDSESQTDFVIQSKHLNEAPIPPRQWNPNIAENIERAVLCCLEKKPENRFNSCGDLLTALTKAAPARTTTPDIPQRRVTVVEQPKPDQLKPNLQNNVQPKVLQPKLDPQHPPTVVIPDPHQQVIPPRKSGSPMGMILAAVVVLALIGGGAYWYTHRQPDDKTSTNEGKITVSCNLDCNWSLDSVTEQPMRAHESVTVTRPYGAHTISASTTDHLDQTSSSLNLSADNKSQSQVLDLASVRTARLSQAPAVKPSGGGQTTPSTPTTAQVYVLCNLDCNWSVDGQPQTQMRANQPTPVTEALGMHAISAATIDNKDEVTIQVRFAASQTPPASIDLATVRSARLAREAQAQTAAANQGLGGNWQGTYKNENWGQSARVRLSMSQQGDLLNGTMAYDQGGQNASSCTVSGIYNATKKSMYLQIGNCKGNAPRYLQQGKLGFLSVERNTRETRGMDPANNSWLEISRP